MNKYDAIRAAERELLISSTRRDGARIRELLHHDFVEIGRSGRRWNRVEIVESLATEDERLTPTAQHWDFVDFFLPWCSSRIGLAQATWRALILLSGTQAPNRSVCDFTKAP